MYQQWLSKQCSGFCGTQSMVVHWDDTRDGTCPNCKKKETADHPNPCENSDRTKLLTLMADKLGNWMSSNYGHPDLTYWLPRYIRLQGICRFQDLPGLLPEMRKVARSQDLIPWTSVVRGKLSLEIMNLQAHHLICSPSKHNPHSLGKKLISQILQLSHAQWVFRNVSLHDKKVGYMRKIERRPILREVDRLSNTYPSALPLDSRYLLEIDFTSSPEDVENRTYWLLSMKSAIKAGMRNSAEANQRRQLRPRSRTVSPASVNPTHDLTTDSLSRTHNTNRATRTSHQPRKQRPKPFSDAHQLLRSIKRDWSSQLSRPRIRHRAPSFVYLYQDFKRTRRINQ